MHWFFSFFFFLVGAGGAKRYTKQRKGKAQKHNKCLEIGTLMTLFNEPLNSLLRHYTTQKLKPMDLGSTMLYKSLTLLTS